LAEKLGKPKVAVLVEALAQVLVEKQSLVLSLVVLKEVATVAIVAQYLEEASI
jgi:hypothetical protein